MRCACIDIGSNTTRLLVAELAGVDGPLVEVAQQRDFTRLGADRAKDGSIAPAKIEAVALAVATQVRVARAVGADSIHAVATAAVRTAPNGPHLCATVEAATGVAVRILGEDEEAHLAFAGATRMLQHGVLDPTARAGVVDVGGGSTELVVGTLARGVEWSASFRVGSGFLADAYLRGDPPAVSELHAVREHIAGVFEGLDVPQPVAAWAVGGSATSLRRLVGGELDVETLERGVRLLASSTGAEVASRFELHPERVRLLPAGMLLLEQASVLFGVPLQIGRGGLREGVLLRALAP